MRKEFPNAAELKKVKWLFLRNRKNLSEKQKEQLNKLLSNPDYALLKEAYEAKESFRAILEEDLMVEQADEVLIKWVLLTFEKKNKYLDKFIKTFSNWYPYILNYFKGKWSNSIVEGVNNRIKMMKRRAFGYNDFNNFRTRVLIEFLDFR